MPEGMEGFDWGPVFGGLLSNIGGQVSQNAAAEAAAKAKAAGATDAEARLKAAEEGRAAAQKALREVSAQIQSETGGYPPVVYVGGGIMAIVAATAVVFALKK